MSINFPIKLQATGIDLSFLKEKKDLYKSFILPPNQIIPYSKEDIDLNFGQDFISFSSKGPLFNPIFSRMVEDYVIQTLLHLKGPIRLATWDKREPVKKWQISFPRENPVEVFPNLTPSLNLIPPTDDHGTARLDFSDRVIFGYQLLPDMWLSKKLEKIRSPYQLDTSQVVITTDILTTAIIVFNAAEI